MEFQLTGNVEKILDVQKFNKRDGSEVIRYSFVLNVNNQQYPYKVAFTVIGTEKWEKMQVAVGGTYSVSFNVSSREWNGRWFTECAAWRVVRVDGSTQQQAPQPQPQPQQAESTQVPAPQPQVQQQDMFGGGQTDGDPLPF